VILENAKVIALTGNNAFSMSEHYVSVPEQGGGKPMGRMKLPEVENEMSKMNLPETVPAVV